MEERAIQCSQAAGSVIFAFCGWVAFHVGRAFNALLSMDWKETIEGLQVLTGIWMPRDAGQRMAGKL